MASPAARAKPAVVVNGRKPCSDCGLVKSLDEFSAHATGAGGRRPYCKACAVLRTKNWGQANRDKLRAKKRREWVKYGPKRNAARRANREHHLRVEQAWRLANAERYRASVHDGNAKRRAAVRGAGPLVRERIAELLLQPCVYCGVTEKIEIDHIIPLARGGKHEVANLAAACQRCNRSKKDRLLSEWQAVV